MDGHARLKRLRVAMRGCEKAKRVEAGRMRAVRLPGARSARQAGLHSCMLVR